MSYGLLDTGPLLKPASQIRTDIQNRIRAIPGFGNVRAAPGSVFGNLIDAFAAEAIELWEGWDALAQSGNRDTASGQSLDNLFAYVSQARLLAEYSTVRLVLWTVGSELVSVPAGNEASQSATGTQWETLDDAEIPAPVTLIEDIDIGDITWISANTIRYAVPSGTDLSGVTINDLLIVSGATTNGNNGAFAVTTIDNVAPKSLDVTNPQRSDAGGNETGSPAIGTVTNGYISVDARSLNKGPFTASGQSIDTINTPVSKWDGVVNLADASAGRNTETDSEFRLRSSVELKVAQGGTTEAVKEKLLQVNDVVYVAATENDSNVAVDGLKPNSMLFTVVGGTDQDVVDTIGKYKPAGIATNGTESGTYTNSSGFPKTIYFDRVTEINPWLIINLVTNAAYPVDGDDLVVLALIAMEFTHGEDLLNYKLIQVIANGDIPGIEEIEVLQGLSDPPTLTDNIPIDPTETVIIIAEQITVNS